MSFPKLYIPKKVTVIGAARSGIGAARFLLQKGVSVFISDSCAQDTLEKILTDNNLGHVAHEAGGHSEKVLEAEVIVLSPGVPSDLPILKQAKSKNIALWSEVELAYRFTDATFLAVTGSSGKSTTTSMLDEILAAAQKEHVLAGNIGIPLVNVVGALSKNAFIAAELSSFQLETIDLFQPKVAGVLNFMKNHLDRYESEEGYYNAKKEIARNMTLDNTLVLNSRDVRLFAWSQEMKKKTRIMFFGSKVPPNDCVWYENGIVWASLQEKTIEVLRVKDMYLSGPHNYDNASAAAAMAIAAGIGFDAINKGICGFKGLEHRLEFVADVSGVRYYNDSKSTTAESVLCAVTAFDHNVHLIVGGRDKGCDFVGIKEAVATQAKGVYLIGEARDRIAKDLENTAPLYMCESFNEAVALAHNNAETGDVVVLSPGCSSFDMFQDYEHRGLVFKAMVHEMQLRTL